VIRTEPSLTIYWELTNEGQEVAASGSHEYNIWKAIPPKTGILQKELMVAVSVAKFLATVPNAKVGFGKAISAGWITIQKNDKQVLVFRKVECVKDVVQKNLQLIEHGAEIDDAVKIELQKRKLLVEKSIKEFYVHRGPAFTTSIFKAETELTADLLAKYDLHHKCVSNVFAASFSDEWKNRIFKKYNFNALGQPLTGGHLHPLLKVRSEYRQVFLEMGFTEMPTNNYVENSFWNFDALFQPQQHPARDIQDTFFVSDPPNSFTFPPAYLEAVKTVHSVGAFGSKGYQYKWKIEEACKNIMRTHTTAISMRMLYELAQRKPFKPVKYFSIDRVFRNETLDATHLAEFHQIEGLVADRGLSLAHLIGILNEFFGKLVMKRLRFKPAYNPYTEPSMEIFSYHEGLKKWVEIGNSGMFRPEVLLPMGLPEDVSVCAWGLSLERPTMIKYGIDNIRDMIGPKVDLGMIYDSPICRIDK
ncbi:unnamed protein product, partial [Soboliphyme baturini]|uniref:phenylalanine--tRNA ligase n=1 Tax=Soboliphyme baturini TaxID=241478 RepID=A0A183J517_9BILA